MAGGSTALGIGYHPKNPFTQFFFNLFSAVHVSVIVNEFLTFL